jgi:hypothetical protein
MDRAARRVRRPSPKLCEQILADVIDAAEL